MATETVKVDGPVKLASTDREAIAFEMMKYIGMNEPSDKHQKDTRDYWLKLYHQCRESTLGRPPESSEK